MDYSKFYHDWLQLDLAPKEVPNFYQILGLKNMEPDVQKIEAAFQSTLNRLQEVNGMTNPEAYTAIMSQVLNARKVFTEPSKKHDYDLQLSQNTGERVWKGYERPSFLTRLRQMSLIALSFTLGLGVVVAMALSVKRNPDGSIIFREEAQVRKAPPFASQLDHVVFRPAFAQDYQPNGYAVAVNKNVQKNQPTQATVSSDSKSDPETPETMPSNTSVAAASQSPEEELEDFSKILSENIAEPESEEPVKVSRRSPLYRKALALNNKPSEEQEVANNEDDLTLELAPVTNAPESNAPENTELAEADLPMEVEPTVQQIVFSPASVINLLEDVRSGVDFSNPDAKEMFTMLQYVTISKFLQRMIDEDGELVPEEINDFKAYMLNVATNLGWVKRFDEAYQLCDLTKEFSEKKGLTNIFEEDLAKKYTSLQNYQDLYNTSLTKYEDLQKDPNNQELNLWYAKWIWMENKDIQEAIPYFAKCQDSQIGRVAQSEIALFENESTDDPEEVQKIANRWLALARAQTDQGRRSQMEEHAKKLYRQVNKIPVTSIQEQ